MGNDMLCCTKHDRETLGRKRGIEGMRQGPDGTFLLYLEKAK
jgi:hypothetical protein